MSTYSNRLQPALQNLLQRVVRLFRSRKSLVKPVSDRKPTIMTCCSVLPPEIVMHDAYIGRRSENNIKCVLRDDLRRKNRTTRYILPHHWLTGDFLSFIVVKHIWFFHGALQL